MFGVAVWESDMLPLADPEHERTFTTSLKQNIVNWGRKP